MAPEIFETTLRSFVHQKPFQPFVIEMEDDQRVLIRKGEKLAFGGGGASYVDSGEIHLIDCEDVLQIKPVAQAN